MTLEGDLWLLFLRIGVLAILYLFLLQLAATLRSSLNAPQRGSRVVDGAGRLVVVESTTPSLPRGQSFTIQPVTSIGRSPTNTIRIDDPFVSGEHAVVSMRGDELWLEDLGSTNGTFVNRRQIAGQTTLQSGDVIQIGQAKIKILK